jgi:ATP-dependent RNA helicase UAP56/SUB2
VASVVDFSSVQFFSTMTAHDHEELIDYEDENDMPIGGATSGTGAGDVDKDKKNFSGIHSTGFR